jgi:hypothetical protein
MDTHCAVGGRHPRLAVKGGIPGNCTLESVEDAPVAELLKKGETPGDG